MTGKDKLREAIVSVCRHLHARNLLAAADGNVSARAGEREILITPAGVNKAFLDPKDVAVMTLDGEPKSGSPSSERLMHLEIYRRCPQAKAVVHAHPPTAIGWSVARPDLTELPAEGLSEVILAVGRIPIAPYARPSTAGMGEALAPFLPQSRVIVLARHGALSWGETLDEAYNGMERLEHSAQILMTAHLLGGVSSLPAAEVAWLREKRRELGDKTL